MTLRQISLAALAAVAFSSAVQAADTPPAPPPPQQHADGKQQGGSGGDAGAKPKAASVVIEEEAPSNEVAPPAPVGDEKLQIGDAIRDNSGAIQECYQRALEKRPTLAGKLVARFDIGPNGRVIGATADGIQDRTLIVCVIGVVRKWEFAKPMSGGKLRVAYPFKFEPQPSR